MKSGREYLFFKYLVKNTQLENREIMHIISSADIIHIKKGSEWIFDPDKFSELGFITQGLLGLFVKSNLNHVVLFNKENQWASTFSSSIMPNYNMPFIYRAIKDTYIYSFTNLKLNDLSISYPSFNSLVRSIYRISCFEILENHFNFKVLNAEQKYRHWLENNPELEQTVPQYLVASYLGILPTSLSRLRHSMSKRYFI